MKTLHLSVLQIGGEELEEAPVCPNLGSGLQAKKRNEAYIKVRKRTFIS